MNCIREEDVFSVIERNRNNYIQCTTPKICGKNCSCYYNQLVLPNKIGNNDFDREFSNKMYIWSKDTCIVCMSQIINKNDAYLTDCGHGFHKCCLSYYFHHIKMVSNKNLNCPLCRTNLGHPEFYERYNVYHEDINGFDILENKNIDGHNLEMLHICKNNDMSLKHYLGMNSECYKCLDYRKNGLI